MEAVDHANHDIDTTDVELTIDTGDNATLQTDQRVVIIQESFEASQENIGEKLSPGDGLHEDLLDDLHSDCQERSLQGEKSNVTATTTATTISDRHSSSFLMSFSNLKKNAPRALQRAPSFLQKNKSRQHPRNIKIKVSKSETFLNPGSSNGRGNEDRSKTSSSQGQKKVGNKRASIVRNPFNPSDRTMMRIHARDPKTGGIFVVEITSETTIREALNIVASQLSMAVKDIVLMAETNEDVSHALARLEKRSPKRNSSSIEAHVRRAANLGRGGRRASGNWGDGVDEEHDIVDNQTTLRTLFSFRFASKNSRSHAPRKGSFFSPASTCSEICDSSPQRSIIRRMPFLPRMSMTDLKLSKLNGTDDHQKRTKRGSAISFWQESCEWRGTSVVEESDVWADDSLYFYRESHERSAIASQPMQWYDFLSHTDLCRMSFDGFSLNEVESINIVARMIENLKLPGILKKSMKNLSEFLYDVCELMHCSSYHNFNHIVDVTQCLYVNLVATHVVSCIRQCELVGAVLAALCHDLDHPGYSNVYVNNENLEVFAKYKESPLENHAVACFRELCVKHSLLENLSEDEQRRVDKMVEVMILRTDMKHHASLMKTVSEKLETFNTDFLETEFCVDLLLSLILKCADISNQARPWKVACKWNLAVYHEFWREGDADKAKGRKVNPIHVRTESKADIAQKSVGFIKFVVKPLYETYLECALKLKQFCPKTETRIISEALAVLKTNLEHYQLEADGLNVPQEGLADRPGICGPQQLKMEQLRFDRSKRSKLPAPRKDDSLLEWCLGNTLLMSKASTPTA